MEKYRSGRNGALSKSVCGQPHVGSNPTFSAKIKVWAQRAHAFYFIGGIRTPSISRANSEESEMRRLDDWIATFSAFLR